LDRPESWADYQDGGVWRRSAGQSENANQNIMTMFTTGINIVNPSQREYPAFEKILLQGHQISATAAKITTINSGKPMLRISASTSPQILAQIETVASW
jgi:hypothetical protein